MIKTVIIDVVLFPSPYVYQSRASYELFLGRREKSSLRDKEPVMMQDQATPACRPLFSALNRGYLLDHYPVITPAFLLAGALGLYAASLLGGNIFPLLTPLGIASAPLCLALAFVLSITGTLASIISILEHIDREQARSASVPEEKGA